MIVAQAMNTDIVIPQASLITIIVTPQVSLITISRQVEVVTGERTLYQVKVLEPLEEAAVEEVTRAVVIMGEAAAVAEMKVEVAEAVAEMKVEVAEAAAINFLLIPMFVRTD
jgi:hypothetical protein